MIGKSAAHDLRRKLWRRSKVWWKTVGAAFASALAFVQFGEDFVTKLLGLLRALGLGSGEP